MKNGMYALISSWMVEPNSTMMEACAYEIEILRFPYRGFAWLVR